MPTLGALDTPPLCLILRKVEQLEAPPASGVDCQIQAMSTRKGSVCLNGKEDCLHHGFACSGRFALRPSSERSAAP